MRFFFTNKAFIKVKKHIFVLVSVKVIYSGVRSVAET
ncbi:MAG: hypothetical protein JWQ85_4072 [Mucilaginibacter sp.]|nr:hypothetical protein [Mucilaginibacter sp.]